MSTRDNSYSEAAPIRRIMRPANGSLHPRSACATAPSTSGGPAVDEAGVDLDQVGAGGALGDMRRQRSCTPPTPMIGKLGAEPAARRRRDDLDSRPRRARSRPTGRRSSSPCGRCRDGVVTSTRSCWWRRRRRCSCLTQGASAMASICATGRGRARSSRTRGRRAVVQAAASSQPTCAATPQASRRARPSPCSSRSLLRVGARDVDGDVVGHAA